MAELNARRADALEKLVASGLADKDRDMWLLQLVDTVSAAAQSNALPDGANRLQKLYEDLKGQSTNMELLAHVRFALLTSDYATSFQAPGADQARIQEKWLANLEQFVNEYPNGKDAPEAMLQLGLAQEFAGEEESALNWYNRIVTDFASSPLAKKATGAKTRLDCVGKPMQLSAPTHDGKRFDLGRYRGKTVLIHYWATWCEPCQDDIVALRRLHAEYGRKNFALVGVNLDDDLATLEKFLRAQKLPWLQLHEPGGLESRMATEMGIFTLPVMILVDTNGQVVNRQIHVGELEQELAKRIR
jgi:thiol-disulfide isomerase/thioredoxin